MLQAFLKQSSSFSKTTYSISQGRDILYHFIPRRRSQLGHQIDDELGILMEVKAVVLGLLLDEVSVQHLFDHLPDSGVPG